MEQFEVHLIKENVTDVCGSGIAKEFSGEALQQLASSIVGVSVHTSMQFADTSDDVVGEVVDAEYVESEGLYCTVEVTDDSIVTQLSDNTLKLAPDISHEELADADTNSTHTISDLEVTNIRPAVSATNHVGEVTIL